MSRSLKRSKTAGATEAKSFVARVKRINGPDSDQQPILHHIIHAADEKDARYLAEEYFLSKHKEMEPSLEEGESLREMMEGESPGGDILSEMQNAWNEIKIFPLTDWLVSLYGDWSDLNAD